MLYFMWKCCKWVEAQSPGAVDYEEHHDIATRSTGRFDKKHSVAPIPIMIISGVLPTTPFRHTLCH